MGSPSWSDKHYADKVAHAAATGKSAFDYDDTLKKAPASARKAHDTLNPHGLKVRESRDSDAHPESKAIAVWFDVTGSMHSIPRRLQAKLPSLMGLLLKKGYIKDPQVLFGAIGDAYSDRVPVQVGQFESGIEMDDNLGNFYLEGGGGGSMSESYDLALYTMARHTSIDCYEKRGEKGYMFLIGDENPYDIVSKRHIEQVFGTKIQDDIKIEDIVAEASEKYEIYMLFVRSGCYQAYEGSIKAKWQSLFPERVIELDDPELVCEVIAGIIGVSEGTVDHSGLVNDLKDMGSTSTSAESASRAIAPVVAGKVAKVGTVSGGSLAAAGAGTGSDI